MDLLADRGRRVPIEELNTSRLLAHARKQAHERNLDDILIADVDSHHYENECFDEFLPFIENDVLRHLVLAGRAPETATAEDARDAVALVFREMASAQKKLRKRG